MTDESLKWCTLWGCAGFARTSARYCPYCGKDFLNAVSHFDSDRHLEKNLALFKRLDEFAKFFERPLHSIDKLPEGPLRRLLHVGLDSVRGSESGYFERKSSKLTPASQGTRGLLLETMTQLFQANENLDKHVDWRALSLVGLAEVDVLDEVQMKELVRLGEVRQCAFCLEHSKVEAAICRFCASNFEKPPLEREDDDREAQSFIRALMLHFAAQEVALAGTGSDRFRELLERWSISETELRERASKYRELLAAGERVSLPLCAWSRRLEENGFEPTKYNLEFIAEQARLLELDGNPVEVEIIQRHLCSLFSAEQKTNSLMAINSADELASALIELGDYTEAEDILLQGIRERGWVNPDDLVRLARVAMARNEFEKAEEHLRKGLPMQGRGLDIEETLLDLYLQTGRINEAEALHQQYFRQVQPHLMSNLRSALLLKLQGRSAEAEGEFLQAIRSNSIDDAFFWFGVFPNDYVRMMKSFHLFLAELGRETEASQVNEVIEEVCRRIETLKQFRRNGADRNAALPPDVTAEIPALVRLLQSSPESASPAKLPPSEAANEVPAAAEKIAAKDPQLKKIMLDFCVEQKLAKSSEILLKILMDQNEITPEELEDEILRRRESAE